MDKKIKVLNLIKLKEAKDRGESEFVLHQRMEEIMDKLDEKKDEEIEISLDIE